jgi:hypothetical protein
MSSNPASPILAFAAAALLALSAPVLAQDTPLDQSSIKINLPADCPLSLISANLGESRAIRRGSAIEIDLHASLTLHNNSQDAIRGVTLLVVAQEAAPMGRGSVSLPWLNVPPGGSFALPIEVQLLRPGRAAAGPLVQIELDGVLFKSLAFYGRDRYDSRRALTAYEVEAQRDRQYFKQILATQGPEGLQKEVVASLDRQARLPRLNVAINRGGRSVSSAAVAASEHLAQFAFLKFPDAPVEPLQGSVQISGNEARSPDIEIRNNSGKAVHYVEIGWIVRDSSGADFMAASIPASGPAELYLAPHQTARVMQDSSLKFTQKGGQPLTIAGMTGFVSQVAFTDGKIWVPDRVSMQHKLLVRVMAPSVEEQRLTNLGRNKGVKALIEELNKF